MTLPYSRCGLTILVNNLGSVISSMHVNVARTSPSILDALFTVLDTWAWNFKSLSIVMQRSFSSLVVSSVVSFMQYSQPGFVVPRCSILHMSLLNPICHLWDQVRRLFKSSWTLVWSSLGTAWCHPQIFLRYTPARQVSHWCIWQTRLDLTHCLGGCRWVFQPMSRACRLQSLVVFFRRETYRSRSAINI